MVSSPRDVVGLLFFFPLWLLVNLFIYELTRLFDVITGGRS